MDDIRADRLRRLLPDYASGQEETFAIYPSRRHLPPRTRLLIDFFVALGREAEARFARDRASVDDERVPPGSDRLAA
jgi:DNA-binding transcriptional LysR family regulator